MRRAQAWEEPTLTDVASLRPMTATGSGLFVILPLPTGPPPQHLSVWLTRRAQVKAPPELTLVAFVMPFTATGILRFFFAVLPSWP